MDLEARIPKDDPIRTIRRTVDQALPALTPFRWFVGQSIDAAVWNHSVLSNSRDHFSVDGTLLEARALLKSFKPKKPIG